MGSDSLGPRGTSGERSGERGFVDWRREGLLSPALILHCVEERE
jgi:hypothetical protein